MAADAVNHMFMNVLSGRRLGEDDATSATNATKEAEEEEKERNKFIQHLLQALIPGYGGGKGHDIEMNDACGKPITFDHPKVSQRYLSMITLTRVFTNVATSVGELHHQRRTNYRWLITGIIIGLALKYFVQILEILVGCCGHRYVQLWNGSRTRFDRALEGVLLHSVLIICTLAMQISLCTIFLTFWRDNHLVMSFIPGFGFKLYICTICFVTVVNMVDRILGIAAGCKDWVLYVGWTLWAAWMLLVCMPMIGYSVYAVNYLLEVRRAGWLEGNSIYSPEFERSARYCSWSCVIFLLFAVADVVVILSMDCKQTVTERSGLPHINPLGPARSVTAQ